MMTASGTARDLDGWLSFIQSVHARTIDMTLDRVAAVLARLVERLSFRVVVVAGTNGKGSCAAMSGAILAACGYRVGVYSSPHLVRFNERIRVDGVEAADHALCRAFERIEACRQGTPLTYFEFATLAAVEIFERRAVDYAVMEVGMGGRLDAVNALPVEAALVTHIGLDHTAWLGEDREAIGREKAHVMRAGCPAVYSDPQPVPAVLDHAARIGARLLLAGRDYRYEPLERGWRWLGPEGVCWQLDPPPIPGPVQTGNAAAVLALLHAMEPGIGLSETRARLGLHNTRLRGRCEVVGRRPLVIVDVAHNPPALEVLQRQLQAHPVTGRTRAVFGMLADKDAGAAAAALNDVVDAWHVADIADPRGRSAAALAASLGPAVRGPVHCHESAVLAYDEVHRQSRPEDRILVFGSFHIAGNILAHLDGRC